MKIWGLAQKRVWYVRGLPWKHVANFGSRTYFKSDLLRLWYMNIHTRTVPLWARRKLALNTSILLRIPPVPHTDAYIYIYICKYIHMNIHTRTVPLWARRKLALNTSILLRIPPAPLRAATIAALFSQAECVSGADCCRRLGCVAVCCNVLQCVALSGCMAVCCSVLQYVAVCCSVFTDSSEHTIWRGLLSKFGVCCSVLLRGAVCCSVLQCNAVCCSLLQRVTVCCSVLQCVAACCSVLQCLYCLFWVHNLTFTGELKERERAIERQK